MSQQRVKGILKKAVKRVYMEYVDTRPEAEGEAAKFELIIGALSAARWPTQRLLNQRAGIEFWMKIRYRWQESPDESTENRFPAFAATTTIKPIG